MAVKKSVKKKAKAGSELMYDFLASTYGLYLKTQNFHWNVKGLNFISLHGLFEDHYNQLSASVDEIAERAVILGAYVDATFETLSKRSIVKTPKKRLSANEMLKELVQTHEDLVSLGYASLDKFQEAGDEVSADLIISCLTFHEKAIWMLKSHLA